MDEKWLNELKVLALCLVKVLVAGIYFLHPLRGVVYFRPLLLFCVCQRLEHGRNITEVNVLFLVMVISVEICSLHSGIGHFPPYGKT